MIVRYDASRCQSIGLCTGLAPDVFELENDGSLRILEPNPGEQLRGDVEEAVRSCPTGALKVED